MEGTGGVAGLAVGVEAVVEAERADWEGVAEAEAEGVAEVGGEGEEVVVVAGEGSGVGEGGEFEVGEEFP